MFAHSRLEFSRAFPSPFSAPAPQPQQAASVAQGHPPSPSRFPGARPQAAPAPLFTVIQQQKRHLDLFRIEKPIATRKKAGKLPLSSGASCVECGKIFRCEMNSNLKLSAPLPPGCGCRQMPQRVHSQHFVRLPVCPEPVPRRRSGAAQSEEQVLWTSSLQFSAVLFVHRSSKPF